VKILVTGGAGFIGCNAVARFLARGDEVVCLDNLSRRGADANLAWLRAHPRADALHVSTADIRAQSDVDATFADHPDIEAVVHLAGQVAVTTSVIDPRGDFEANALGTLNVLEAARRAARLRALLYASTNKVYGGLEALGVELEHGRYAFRDLPSGVPETLPLDFHSPYGCSKGAADQYVIDYARIYGMPNVTLRQSCIYGPRQLGVEDQGWVAWFTIAAVTGRPITIYGDGLQVRDVLYVDDLLDAYEAAITHIDAVKGQAINLGGGPKNVLAIREVLDLIAPRIGRTFPVAYADWRPGDQRVFIADISRARDLLGWSPRTSVSDGVGQLCDWVVAHQSLFNTVVKSTN
jgi:CDP-paratose 2-epimerase